MSVLEFYLDGVKFVSGAKEGGSGFCSRFIDGKVRIKNKLPPPPQNKMK